MSDLWTPSDSLLEADPIAAAKVANPHGPTDLVQAGVVLPDDVDDDALEAAAAVALAELDDDDAEGDEPGTADDEED